MSQQYGCNVHMSIDIHKWHFVLSDYYFCTHVLLSFSIKYALFFQYKKNYNQEKQIFNLLTIEVRNSRVIKSSYEIDLCKMMSLFELLTRKFLQKALFRVTNSTS